MLLKLVHLITDLYKVIFYGSKPLIKTTFRFVHPLKYAQSRRRQVNFARWLVASAAGTEVTGWEYGHAGFVQNG